VKKFWTSVVFALALSAVLTGCAGKIKYPSYYTLNVPPPPDPPAAEGVRTSVAVREFRSPAYLRQGPIVYRATPEQVGFYEYHRWAMDPRSTVTNAVSNRLRASGNFAQVKSYDGRADVDYIVSGRLEKLEEIDYDGGVKVQVELSAQMTKLSTGETVWTNNVSEVGAVERRDVASVVSAMSHTMDQAIAKLLTPVPAATAK
jgi:ABC-type uncharacterized transport system auxiliary subunit